MNQKRCLILISLRHLLFITILRNIKAVNEIMRFLYPKYRRNRLTAQRAGGGYNDQSNYCSAIGKSGGHVWNVENRRPISNFQTCPQLSVPQR